MTAQLSPGFAHRAPRPDAVLEAPGADWEAHQLLTYAQALADREDDEIEPERTEIEFAIAVVIGRLATMRRTR